MNKNLLDDKPILDPKDDLLGHDKFAEDIAKLLASQPKAANFVLSINGEWGAGKSSCVNMIKYFLNKDHKKKVIFSDFSPWFFNGEQEALLKEFLSVLFRATDNLLSLSATAAKTVYEEFNSLLRCLKFGVSIPSIPVIGIPEASMEVDFSQLPKAEDPTIFELKDKISKRLASNSRKIIIFIDDLDRLNKTEVLQIFGLIKVVADFPNVIYVLSCDKGVLCDILQVEQGIEGEKYLEKIIQLPLDLPLPETKHLRALLFDGIDFGKKDDELSAIRSYYQHGIKQTLNTPRKVKRFRQNFDTLYNLTKDEVFAADFYALTFLRLFAPKSYQIIKDNIGWLAMPDTPDRNHYGMFEVKNSGLYDRAHNLLDMLHKENSDIQKDDWKHFIGTMFPNMIYVLSEQKPQVKYKDEDFKNSRIFCTDACWAYFKFNYYNPSITRQEFNKMLASIKKKGDFTKYIKANLPLKKFDEHSLSFRMLEAMRYNYRKDIPVNKMKLIIPDILKSGFTYDTEYDVTYDFFRTTNSSTAEILVSIYFRALNTPKERTELLLKLMPEADLAFLCYYVRYDESFWDTKLLETVKSQIAARIEKDKASILIKTGLKHILGTYLYLCPDKFDAFIKGIANTNSKKMLVIRALCPEIVGGTWYTNSTYKHQSIKELAESVDKASLSDDDKEFLEEFVRIQNDGSMD
ncbi:kAP P-loop domain protein [Proteobacteria bacterium CAG:495]|nr:kAP P-loop domain protein [Proteobacteria bacterium CAG:495]